MRIILWLIIFLLTMLPFFNGQANTLLEATFSSHRYLSGGLIFAVMGLLGETLRSRMIRRPFGLRSLVVMGLMWGVCGAAASLLFYIINTGVVWSQAMGFLPGGGYSGSRNPLAAFLTSFIFTGPFFTSVIINIIAVSLWPTRRILLAWSGWAVDYDESDDTVFNQAISSIDWSSFIKSEIIHVPLTRIPALTLVIMMPQQYWIYLTAWLLIILLTMEGAAIRFTGGAYKKPETIQ